MGLHEVWDDPAPPHGWFGSLGTAAENMAGWKPDFFLPCLVMSVVVSHRYRHATRVLECSHTSSGFVTTATSAHRLAASQIWGPRMHFSRLHEDKATTCTASYFMRKTRMQG